MPQAANITVNNGAAVAKTFTLLSPASGDGGIAKWALKEGGSPVAYPVLTMLARPTPKKARKTQLKVHIPYSYTDTTTGLVKAGPAFEFNGDFTVPDEFPESMRADAVAFCSNIVANTLVKECYRDGYPAV